MGDNPPAVRPQENPPAWSVNLAFSVGNTADAGHGKVMFLDAEKYPSVKVAVDALNEGTLSCPEGICVVRSERQKLFFLLARADKQQERAKMANDIFQIKDAQLPALGQAAPERANWEE